MARRVKEYLVNGKPSVVPLRQIGVSNFPSTVERAADEMSEVLGLLLEQGYELRGFYQQPVGPEYHWMAVLYPVKATRKRTSE